MRSLTGCVDGQQGGAPEHREAKARREVGCWCGQAGAACPTSQDRNTLRILPETPGVILYKTPEETLPHGMIPKTVGERGVGGDWPGGELTTRPFRFYNPGGFKEYHRTDDQCKNIRND